MPLFFNGFGKGDWENIPITRYFLHEKAREVNKELKVEVPYEYSTGWHTKFKNQHGMRYLKASGDKVSAGKATVDEFIEKFKKIVDEEKILLQLIYNMDETGLFWCNLPRKTFVSEEEKALSAIKDDRR